MPRGPEAEGRRDGRRPCARVAREGELSLGRAQEGLLAWEGATALEFFSFFFFYFARFGETLISLVIRG